MTALEGDVSGLKEDVRQARALADQRVVEVAAAREQVGRAEAGKDAAVEAAETRQAAVEA